MAVGCIIDFAGGTAAKYGAVFEQMDLGGRLPPGALLHAAGTSEDGWRVCDVWKSQDAFSDFAEKKIGPITAKQRMRPTQLRTFEVDQVRRGEAGPIAFVQFVTFPDLDADGFAAMDAAILGPERAAPAGCVFHVNGPLRDGWCVLDYWTSKEIRDAFIENHVMPAMQAAGIEGRPDIEETSVHNTLTE